MINGRKWGWNGICTYCYRDLLVKSWYYGDSTNQFDGDLTKKNGKNSWGYNGNIMGYYYEHGGQQNIGVMK